MAAFGGPQGVLGSSFFDPIACPSVQRAISADLDYGLGAEAYVQRATLLWASDIERWAYSGLFNLQYCNGLSNESDDVPFLFKDIENPI